MSSPTPISRRAACRRATSGSVSAPASASGGSPTNPRARATSRSRRAARRCRRPIRGQISWTSSSWRRRRRGGARRRQEARHPCKRAARRRQPGRDPVRAGQCLRRRHHRHAVPAHGWPGGVQVRGARARRIGARDRRRRGYEARRHRLADSAPGERAHTGSDGTQARPCARQAGRHRRSSRQYLGRLRAARARRICARGQDPQWATPAPAGRGRRLHLGFFTRHAMKLAFVFPGQGSQAVGMLKGYDGLPEIGNIVDQAAGVLGIAFVRLMDHGPAEALNLTVNTQPAMVTAGYAVYRAWRALGGPEPDFVAGHSLGEYTALTAAGALKFGDALPLVRFRAQAMQEAVPEGRGAMAAILMLDDELVRAACAEAAGEVQAVNFNAPGQGVIAGEEQAVERAIEACKAKGAKRAMPLPVSAPFHSTLMRPAAEKLKGYLQKMEVLAPRITVINNVDVAIAREPAAIK